MHEERLEACCGNPYIENLMILISTCDFYEALFFHLR